MSTPTPWHFIGGESSTSTCFWIQTEAMRDGNGYIAKMLWFSNSPDETRPSKETAKANAELIVRAVNNHAQLVEALKIAQANLQFMPPTDVEEQISKALAGAEAENG